MVAPVQRQKSRVARLTWRGRTALGVGGFALVIGYATGRAEVLPLAAFLLVLPMVARAYVRFRPVRFTAERQFSPAVISAGTSTEVTLDIANVAGFRSPPANWRDTWPWYPFVTAVHSLEPLTAGDPHRIVRGSSIRMTYPITPTRRGVFEIGPLILDFADPFGLAEGAVVAAGTARLTVTPASVELVDGAVVLAADEGATRVRRRRSFGGEDDLMTREYRQGDAMRRVHWRATAHHGELMVRQEEQRSHARASILLDTLRSNYSDWRGAGSVDEAESDSFELAVNLCSSLSMYLADRGFVVEVVETGQRQLSAVDQRDEYLESLAAIQLSARSADRMSVIDGSVIDAGAIGIPADGPLFALLASGFPVTLIDRMVAQGGSFERAIAFILDPANDAVSTASPTATPTVQRLRSAGWLCVAVGTNVTVEAAWAALSAEQERADGLR